MSFKKAFLRNILLPSIVKLRLEKLISWNTRRDCTVIMYHGVTDIVDPKLNGRHLTSVQFEKHLKYLKKSFNIVPLSELMNRRRNGEKFSRKTIAITFDDGYLNNYTAAYPLLVKYNLPATFFIITGGITIPDFVNWPDIFDIISRYSDTQRLTINESFERKNGQFYSSKLKLSISDYFKKLGDERITLLEEIKSQCNFPQILSKVPEEYWKLMNAYQVKEVSDSGLIEIGSHTHLHYNLGLIPENLVKQEVSQSKKLLEEIIGKPVITIAYPDGSYTERVKQISLDCKYQNLIAVSSQAKNDKGDNNIITRFGISNTTTFESNMVQLNMYFRKNKM